MSKISGHIIKLFLEEGWTKDTLCDDWFVDNALGEVWSESGDIGFDLDAEHDPVELLGHLQWQGTGYEPASVTIFGRTFRVASDGLDPLPIIKAWLKSTSSDTRPVRVNVPVSKMAELLKWCEKNSVTVDVVE